MKHCLFNLTDNAILFKFDGCTNDSELIVLPEASAAIPSGKQNFVISSIGGSQTKSEKVFVDNEVERRYVVNLSKLSSSRRSLLAMPEDCPWRIYRDRTSEECIDILVLPKRPLESFLSDMSDTTPLYSLCLPGTHDTMAFYGWPISQCQSVTTPLLVQLNCGIRLLDVRLAKKKGRLYAYHGQYPQRTTFQSILADLHTFLTSPKSARETVIVSLKQEDYDTHTPENFSALVRAEIEVSPGGMGMWYLENRIPTLGEVRGKAIMFSRFGVDGAAWEGGLEGMGIHPTNWPDSEKDVFSWTCKDVLVRTQDWYHIPSFLSIPEKTQLATDLLLPPPTSITQPVLSITYFSASSFPFATPTVVSTGFGWPRFGLGVEGVNARATRFLLATLKKKTSLCAWTFMDFYDMPVGTGVVPLLIEQNFRG